MNEQASTGNNQASILFNALFGPYFENHKGYIALTWRKPGEYRFHDEFHSDTYFAASRADDLREQKVDAFFAVAPRIRPNKKKKAIRDVLALHIDADGKDKSIERKIKQLNPSALVRSGSKYCFHPYFFLEVPVRTPESTRLVEELNRLLAMQVGVDPQSTFDTSRILRVPGTFNLKNPNKPRVVELIDLDPNLRYPLSYFVERLGPKVNNFRYEEETIWEKEQRDHRGHFLNPQERAYVDTLLGQGLFETRSRNYSMLLLVRFCYEQGMGPGETICWVRNFFSEHHNNKSKDWLSNPEKCVRLIEYCVKNWWRKAYRAKRVINETLPLSATDYLYVESLNITRRNKEFLVDTLTYILNNKQGDTIILSARQFKKLRTVHYGNEKNKLALLDQLGIIEIKNEAKPKSRLAREFRVLYKFGSRNENQSEEDRLSELFESISDRIDALILTGHTNEEIRASLPNVTRQHIFYRRRRIEKMVQRDQIIVE